MALYRQTDTGEFVEVESSVNYFDFTFLIKKLERNGQLKKIHDYIRNSIDDGMIFSVASKFGGVNGVWTGTPLDDIYQVAGKDSELTAKLLGTIVYALMSSEMRDTWRCTKVNMQSRDFRTLQYWREGREKMKKAA